jgi:hypothetical protein
VYKRQILQRQCLVFISAIHRLFTSTSIRSVATKWKIMQREKAGQSPKPRNG